MVVAVNAVQSYVCAKHARHLVVLQPASPRLGSLPLKPLWCEGVCFLLQVPVPWLGGTIVRLNVIGSRWPDLADDW